MPNDNNSHSVQNFNPAEYEILDYLDNKPPQYYPGATPYLFELAHEQWKSAIRRYFPTSACVTTGNTPQLPEHNIHKCRHCGQTNVRYIVAVKHLPTNTNMVFGDVCVSHLGFPNYQAFRAAQVRARAAQGNSNLRVFQLRERFLQNYPELKEMLESGEISNPVHDNNSFAKDVLSKLDRYGSLSPRQVESVVASLKRDYEHARLAAQRASEEERRRTTCLPAPCGRATVEGKILMVKNYGGNGFGFNEVAWKMLVLLTTGAKVFVSVPAGLCNEVGSQLMELREKQVKLTATFKPKDGDPTFAYGKRPIAKLVEPQPALALKSTETVAAYEEI
jgi:hypothetical protein